MVADITEQSFGDITQWAKIVDALSIQGGCLRGSISTFGIRKISLENGLRRPSDENSLSLDRICKIFKQAVSETTDHAEKKAIILKAIKKWYEITDDALLAIPMTTIKNIFMAIICKICDLWYGSSRSYILQLAKELPPEKNVPPEKADPQGTRPELAAKLTRVQEILGERRVYLHKLEWLDFDLGHLVTIVNNEQEDKDLSERQKLLRIRIRTARRDLTTRSQQIRQPLADLSENFSNATTIRWNAQLEKTATEAIEQWENKENSAQRAEQLLHWEQTVQGLRQEVAALQAAPGYSFYDKPTEKREEIERCQKELDQARKEAESELRRRDLPSTGEYQFTLQDREADVDRKLSRLLAECYDRPIA